MYKRLGYDIIKKKPLANNKKKNKNEKQVGDK